MIREAAGSYNCAMASIYVTKAGVIYFNSRNRTGDSSTLVTGPSVSLPIYLRLTREGNTLKGLYSTDNETWTSLGSYTQTDAMPKKFFAGFNSFSTDSSLNSAAFTFVSFLTSVPQQSSNLLLWLRSDAGVVLTSGAVSQWTDQSSQGNHATQSTAGQRPTLTTGAINNGVMPTITFDSSQQQHLTCPTDFADLTSGASIYCVLKPTNSSGTWDPCAFGNASNSDAVFPEIVNSQASFKAYNGSTSSSVTTTSNPISTSQYQVLETILQPGASAGTATGQIIVNGTQEAQSTSMENLTNTSRTNNIVGAGIGPANYFNGGIAEILVYKTALSENERLALRNYFQSKFAVGNTPTFSAPSFTPSGGIFTAAQTVSLSQPQDATTYYSRDGSTPDATSQWFNSPSITVNQTETIKAKAIGPYFNDSAVASATFRIEQNTLPVTRDGLVLWLRSDTDVTTSSGAVTKWGDVSGSLNDAAQSNGANRPTLVSNAVNGLPAIAFASSQFLQLPAGMANFTSGASIFVVIKPTSVTSGARILDFGNGATSDNLQLQEPSTNAAALYVYSGSSPSSVSSSNALTVGNFQLLEAIHNGSSTATIYTNAVQGAQSTSMNAIPNITRSNNYIGQGGAGGNNFIGQIAELLLYRRSVTISERAAIEGYLFNRYNMMSVNTTPAPKLSVATSTLSAPTQVAISAASPSAEIRYTTDGSTPGPSSTLYTKPINISYTTTLKAIAIQNGIQSSVQTATYTLNSTQWPAPSSDATPLQINIQQPTTLSPQ